MEKLSETEGRIGDPGASLRRADADWAAASMTAAQQAVRAGFSDGKKLLTALSRVGLDLARCAGGPRCRREPH